MLLFQQQGHCLRHLQPSGKVAGSRQFFLFRQDGAEQEGKSLAVPLPYAPGKGLGGMDCQVGAVFLPPLVGQLRGETQAVIGHGKGGGVLVLHLQKLGPEEVIIQKLQLFLLEAAVIGISRAVDRIVKMVVGDVFLKQLDILREDDPGHAAAMEMDGHIQFPAQLIGNVGKTLSLGGAGAVEDKGIHFPAVHQRAAAPEGDIIPELQPPKLKAIQKGIVSDAAQGGGQDQRLQFGVVVESFQNNVFESHERITIQAAFPKSEKGTKICDLNRLYDAIKPAETMVTKISLSGQYYDFVITQEGLFASGWIVYTSETGWQKARERTYAWTNGATITRDEESTFDGVPCRIVEYRNTTETYRDILIETEQDGKKVDMVLRYLLEDKRACPERVSDSAPWQLRIFSEDNGVFYEVVIGTMLDTPTYEWLSSFGLTPYVPADSE